MSENKQRRYLLPAEIEAGIDGLHKLANRENVQMALLGGVAMQVYGSDRLTKDVDVVVSHPIETKGKPLSFGGVQGTVTKKEIPVDIIWRDDEFEDLYRESLLNTRAVPGFSLRVVDPEYLAAMKMAAARAKDETDLLFLLASKKIDLKRTRTIVGRHLGAYAKLAFDQFLAEAKWRRDTGR